jgi:putative colanic acid biosynthesis acetyltransferase WcaF
MQLSKFNNADFDRGRSRLVETCWRVVEGLLFNSWLPGSGWRVQLLRLFGASVGNGVVIKPHVRIKFPWKLKVGNHSWIGEDVWIDNLAEVSIGNNCCISQGAFLCTGSHRWDKETFDLATKSIVISDQCWLGAKSRIAPGVTLEQGAVLALGGVAIEDLPAWQIYRGNPAVFDKKRNGMPRTG